jgi:hypothetical protein
MKLLILPPDYSEGLPRTRVFLEDGTELHNVHRMESVMVSDPRYISAGQLHEAIKFDGRLAVEQVTLTFGGSGFSVEVIEKPPKRKGAKR